MNFELHRSTNFTHFCHKNVASRIYALFYNKNFNFTRIFARILLVFLLKKCSYFARIFKKLSSYEEFVTLVRDNSYQHVTHEGGHYQGSEGGDEDT